MVWFKKGAAIAMALLVALAMGACGEDGDGGGSGDGGGDNGGAGAGPDYQVDGEIEGGSMAGSVDSESDQSQAMQNSAVVFENELSVYLATPSGVLFFKYDSGSQEIPGAVSVARDLDGPGFLTLTTGAGIFEGEGGQIRVDLCPNDGGTTVTGQISGVNLVSVLDESDGGSLTASFRATVVQTDASAMCAPVSSNNDGGGEDVSPGGQCENNTCDGPCCPYLPAYQQCVLSCTTNECQNVADPFGCFNCLSGCLEESGMLGDAACSQPLMELAQCSSDNGCEGGDLTEDECIASNCCAEHKAVF
jgi:hypothetical protein